MRLLFRLAWCWGVMAISTSINAQDLGIFTDTWDSGNHGTIDFDSRNQVYRLSSNLTDENRPSAQHFLFRKIHGDFILRVHANDKEQSDQRIGSWGLMVKEDPGKETPEVVAEKQWNKAALKYNVNTKKSSQGKYMYKMDVMQLERKGSTFIMSMAQMGQPWELIELPISNLPDTVYVGLFVANLQVGTTYNVSFSNVRLIVPPQAEHVPYQDYLGSHIEVMDVESGHRTVVHTAPNSLQAPNWMLDDYVFTYNADGFLYDFDVRTGVSTKINTGFADRNNNDHVHSFDGTRMGISHAPEEEGHSIIYTIPRLGGTPQRVTPLGPSYLHGWSPDGRYLVYTGRRGEAWDLYRIPADGGEEERLTDAPGLDDGSEYSPDGKYIYFNSNRTGTMQIWRMKADGSEQEQLTFDEYQDWFPHISPDGKWMVFISYLPEVPSGSHPFYKQVYIRLMPVSGGPIRVIAYVYGGQGTMNVPNWSPDSKKIAFVSNSDFLNFSKKP